MNICKVCSNEKNNLIYKVKEMMYGTGKEYSYLECSICGCLQLIDPPNNISEFYPSKYYSFEEFKNSKKYSSKNIIKNLRSSFFKIRGKLYFSSNNVIKIFAGKFLDYFLSDRQPFASLRLPYLFYFFNALDINFGKKILDVGSGAGYGLVLMSQYGFTNLTGIDPFIERDITYYKNVKILKRSFEDINEKYDIVMFQHSFEHMKDPLKIFEHLRDVTHKDSEILISIPVADSYAWEKYRTDWVQLDAPRHFFIHTKKSLNFLAEATGFRINTIKYDSNEFQFCGSEQYKAGIPLMDERSYKKNLKHNMFNKEQLKYYKKQASKLNKAGLGDQAIFFLKKNME